MQSLLGYKIIKELYANDKMGVYRGINATNHKTAILKALKNDFPEQREIAQLKYEYNILKNLHLQNVIHAERLVKQNRQYVLILEDIPDGISLNEFLAKKHLRIGEFLAIAIKMTEGLVELHAEDIIHKDINPNNIVISPTTGQLKLIDFNLASRFTGEKQEIENMSVLEGTLSYISPEQTGRMNRSIDNRSDLYSLGITFYQMLTGKLPFETDDPIELIHCHIAKYPIAPDKINKNIPKTLSNLVMKLIAKSAEERYQSAKGLLVDLQHCLKSWRQLHNISDFKLEEKILYNKLQLSQRLYGREDSLKLLEEEFHHVSEGKVELIFVRGEAGIGKSSLINEIHKPLSQRGGYFISGKYDQFRQDVPYLAIIQAFRKLIRQILTEPPSKIGKWQNKLSHALEKSGSVLTEILPELVSLIGKQPPAEKLNAADSRNRFEMAFLDFFSVFTQSSQPLVVFLDDLQWADISSLNLLKLILRHGVLQNLLVIGAYRESPKDRHHVLDDFIDYVKKEQTVKEILLLPLKLEDIKHLIADTFQQQENVDSLAEIVLEKTGGNPFFINTFLTMLYDKKYITYDERNGNWIWGIESIKELAVTENVVDYISEKILNLPKETQEILKIAASIGDQFNLETMLDASDFTHEKVLDYLNSAIKQSLILPIGEGYELASVDKDYALQQAKNITYRFSHDRIRQAAYGLLKIRERKALALKIGRLLIKNTSDEDKAEHVFEIVGQFNRCLSLLTDPHEIKMVIDLNIEAGQKAKQSTAYDLALKYFSLAKRLLGKYPWKENYEIAMVVYVSYAECLHLSGKYTRSAKAFDEIINHTQTPLDKARLIMLQALSFSLQLKNDKVIRTALSALAVLGIKIKENPSIFTLLWNFIKVKTLLRNKTSDDLLQMQDCTNKEIDLICEIMARIFQPGLFSHPKLLILLSFMGIQLSLKYGSTASTAIFYLWYGTLHLMMNQSKLGFGYGDLAIHLAEKYENNRIQSIILVGYSVFNAPWHLPYRKCLNYLQSAYQIGKQSGEIVFIQITVIILPFMMLVKGDDILDIEKKMKRSLSLSRFNKFNDGLMVILTLERGIALLKGEKEWPYLEERIHDYLDNKIPYNSAIPLFANPVLMLMFCCFYEKWDLAEKIIKKSYPIIKTKRVKLNYFVSEFFYYSSLVYLTRYEKAGIIERFRLRKKIHKNVAYLKQISTYSLDNFGAKYYLILSLKEAILDNDLSTAYQHYAKSIALANANGMTHVIAMANECYARFYFSIKQYTHMQGYLQQSILAYNYWGAKSKSMLLQTQYAEILSFTKSIVLESNQASSLKSTFHPISTTRTINIVDFASIMKSVQIISSNVDLEELLKTSIKMLIENAGAERGLLFIVHKNELVIEAECLASSSHPTVLKHESFHSRDDFAKSIIYYVQRTYECVVLDNASRNAQFGEDPYIQSSQPRSILCMPIIHQGRFLGALYLENNLTAAAFTPNCIELLQILSSQIAISLENALLNAAYNQFVPHEFLDLLGRDSIVDVSLGDQIQRQMTILFCDIRDFTSISEKLTPNEVFQFINEYLGYMEPIIKRYGGFIDKYIGDAIMALFPGSADDAVSAALAMISELNLFNQKRTLEEKIPIRVGVGINSGILTLGTIGTSHHLETSVLSDAVNQASRLEELTKVLGSTVLISQQVYDQLDSPSTWGCRYIGKVRIRGKETEVGVWEIYASDSKELREIKHRIQADYDKGVMLFNQQKYQEALVCFNRCLSELPEDPPIRAWVERCKSAFNSQVS